MLPASAAADVETNAVPYSPAIVLDIRYSTQLLSLGWTRAPSAQLRTPGAYDDKPGLPVDVFKLLLNRLTSARAFCRDSITVVFKHLF
jgi:hypothetical protein